VAGYIIRFQKEYFQIFLPSELPCSLLTVEVNLENTVLNRNVSSDFFMVWFDMLAAIPLFCVLNDEK